MLNLEWVYMLQLQMNSIISPPVDLVQSSGRGHGVFKGRNVVFLTVCCLTLPEEVLCPEPPWSEYALPTVGAEVANFGGSDASKGNYVTQCSFVYIPSELNKPKYIVILRPLIQKMDFEEKFNKTSK